MRYPYWKEWTLIENVGQLSSTNKQCVSSHETTENKCRIRKIGRSLLQKIFIFLIDYSSDRIYGLD